MRPRRAATRASSSVKNVLSVGMPRACAAAGRPVGRVDPEHRDAVLVEDAQHVAVVAGRLDDEMLPAQGRSCAIEAFGAAREVLHQRRRDRREVRIRTAEENLRLDRLEDLHQRAALAERDGRAGRTARARRAVPRVSSASASGVAPNERIGCRSGEPHERQPVIVV